MGNEEFHSLTRLLRDSSNFPWLVLVFTPTIPHCLIGSQETQTLAHFWRLKGRNVDNLNGTHLFTILLRMQLVLGCPVQYTSFNSTSSTRNVTLLQGLEFTSAHLVAVVLVEGPKRTASSLCVAVHTLQYV